MTQGFREYQDKGGSANQYIGSIGGGYSSYTPLGVNISGQVDIMSSQPDYYQGTANWYKAASAGIPNYEKVEMHLDVNIRESYGNSDFYGIVVFVWDFRKNLVASGIDFIFGKTITDMIPDVANEFETLDDDIVSTGLHYSYDQIVGNQANTFIVGVTGFHGNIEEGTFSPLHYGLGWSFA